MPRYESVEITFEELAEVLDDKLDLDDTQTIAGVTEIAGNKVLIDVPTEE